MSEEKPEQKGTPIGDIADVKITLKIWDVPPELYRRFIATAKGSYANKSWLLLQDLMMKAAKYDEWLSSGKIAELEGRVKVLEGRLEAFEAAIAATPTEPEKEGEKVPATFGGGKSE